MNELVLLIVGAISLVVLGFALLIGLCYWLWQVTMDRCCVDSHAGKEQRLREAAKRQEPK